MNIREINRTVKFDTRELSSPFRCKYNDRRLFDILHINCVSADGTIKEVYEIESQYLPNRDSISFKAQPKDNGFEIVSWSPKEVAKYIKRIK